MIAIIRCAHQAVVPIEDLKLKFNPKNRNVHSDEQIERLAEILKYQGARYCAKISNQSGFITSGHGRILAAERAGWREYPVDYQDYADDAQEYADMTADNEIARWAVLDMSGLNGDIGELGPDFNLDMLGMKDFKVDVADHGGTGDDEPENKDEDTTPGKCPNCGQKWKKSKGTYLSSPQKSENEPYSQSSPTDTEQAFI